MAKSPDHRTSAGAYDGALPIVQSAGKTAHGTSAVDDLGGFVAPCDLTLVQLDLRVNVAATHADAEFNIGVNADPDANVDAYDLTDVAAGHVSIPMDNAAVVSRTVSAGDYVKGYLGAASAVGSVSFTAVWMPTSGQ